VYDLTRFALTDMTRLGVDMRKAGAGADSLEGVANRLVRLLYDQLTMPPGLCVSAPSALKQFQRDTASPLRNQSAPLSV